MAVRFAEKDLLKSDLAWLLLACGLATQLDWDDGSAAQFRNSLFASNQ